MLNAIALFFTTVLILIGILLNRSDTSTLRGEFNDLRGKMSKLQEDVTRQIGDLKDANHKDALEIMRQMTALYERVAVVEAKQK
jgi:hypothetical protein